MTTLMLVQNGFCGCQQQYSQRNAQPSTALPDCIRIRYPLTILVIQAFSPGSANQCILGDVYLRNDLSREQYSHLDHPQCSNPVIDPKAFWLQDIHSFIR